MPRAAFEAQTSTFKIMGRIKNAYRISAIFAATLALLVSAHAEPSENLKKTVLFVSNDSAAPALDAGKKALETSIASRLGALGFNVIDHDMVLRGLNDYIGNANAKYRTQAEKFKKNMEAVSPANNIFDDASGFRIAEILGADYIMAVSITSMGIETKAFDGYGIKTVNNVYRLRSNYRLYEAGEGAGTSGGAVVASKNVRQTAELATISDDILNELFEDTAEQMAGILGEQNAAGKIIAKREQKKGHIRISFQISGFSFPEVTVQDGVYRVHQTTLPLGVSAVTADIDGVAYTLGESVSLSRGIHTLKINQKDLEPVAKNIFITGAGDQVLVLQLSLSDDARARYKADMAFVEEIKNRSKLSDDRRIITEAEAEKLKGIAKMFENSGFKIINDYKVDAKEFPQINKIQSIFGQ